MTKFYTHLDEINERYFGFIKKNLGLDVRAWNNLSLSKNKKGRKIEKIP